LNEKEAAEEKLGIKPTPLTAAPWLACDWLEIKAASQPNGRYSLARLKRTWDVNRETEDSDPEGQQVREFDTDAQGVSGEDADAYLDSISDELGDRVTALGDAYPFEISPSGRTISLKSDRGFGGEVYLFCLLLSHSQPGEILDGSWLPKITHKTRDLFQACATLAAAYEVEGCAISFGWPRPNNNPPFLTKLRDVYELFGEGEVVAHARPGASPSPKDAEIDVIAWRPRADRAAGTRYLLGQVASGANWQAKSVKGPPIDGFHDLWFSRRPASDPSAYIFIPHAIVPNVTGTRVDVMAIVTTTFGTVLDRLRLPKSAGMGLDLARRPGCAFTIERVADAPKIGHWVRRQIDSLRKAQLVDA
jgi:hypothetical protein